MAKALKAAAPTPAVPPWPRDSGGRVTPRRRAEFWRQERGGGTVACSLCYRQCVLAPGEAGWCKVRENAPQGGRMELTAHGVLTCAVRQMRGYGPDPFLTYKPGATALFLGGTSCTAGCSFCMSTEQTWRPERVPWVAGRAWGPGTDGGWYAKRAVLHPQGAVDLARRWGCQQVEFGINEPTLTWEYTHDVALLARTQRPALDVVVETNGFTTPAAVRKLAPLVQAVDLGIKGSAAPAFYERWMRSPGAVPHVLRAAQEWRRAGAVHLLIGDVVAPPRMQTDAETEEAQKRLYGWIAAELGPHTPLLLTPMMRPGPTKPDPSGEGQRWNGWLLPADAGPSEVLHYADRLEVSRERARAAGLAYAHGKGVDETIRCHGCGGVLLRFRAPKTDCEPCLMATHFCVLWAHEQHATGGRCDHCGARVPIATLTPQELARAQETAQGAWRERLPRDYDPRPYEEGGMRPDVRERYEAAALA